MATSENIGLLTHVDELGNKTLLYPITKKEAVDGLDEIEAKANNAVSKAGDTMTGPLTVDSAGKSSINKLRSYLDVQYKSSIGISIDQNSKVYGVIDIQDVTNGSDQFGLGVSITDQKPFFYNAAGGEYYREELLHTGNKPSGFYTGNGSIAARTIDTKGIGSAIAIWSGAGNALVLHYGGLVYSSSGGAEPLGSSVVNFRDGVLTLTTDHLRLNTNGTIYYYQVL